MTHRPEQHAERIREYAVPNRRRHRERRNQSPNPNPIATRHPRADRRRIHHPQSFTPPTDRNWNSTLTAEAAKQRPRATRPRQQNSHWPSTEAPTRPAHPTPHPRQPRVPPARRTVPSVDGTQVPVRQRRMLPRPRMGLPPPRRG